MMQVTAKGCFSMSDHEVPRLPGILGLVQKPYNPYFTIRQAVILTLQPLVSRHNLPYQIPTKESPSIASSTTPTPPSSSGPAGGSSRPTINLPLVCFALTPEASHPSDYTAAPISAFGCKHPFAECWRLCFGFNTMRSLTFQSQTPQFLMECGLNAEIYRF